MRIISWSLRPFLVLVVSVGVAGLLPQVTQALKDDDPTSVPLVLSDNIEIVQNIELGYTNPLNESVSTSHNKVVACTLNSWSHWRTSPEAKFDLSNIDPTLCTHLVYRIAKINNVTFDLQPIDKHLATDPTGPEWFAHLRELKDKNPKLKLMLSVGGWDHGVASFQKVASDGTARASFIASAVSLLKSYHFDGLDICWMWPGLDYRGGSPRDKSDLTFLLQAIKAQFQPEGLLLSINMVGQVGIVADGFELQNVARYADLIFLTPFDFTGSWDTKTGHHSPLQSYSKEETKNWARIIEYVIKGGVPTEKIVLGIAIFGRQFNLIKPSDAKMDHGLGEPSKGGFNGNFYPETQEFGYHEICHELTVNKNNWTVYRDLAAKVPFMKSGYRWISFDDPQSVREKVAYGMSNKVGGFMPWTIDTDDFHGVHCSKSGVTYSLLRTINNAIFLEENNKEIILPNGNTNNDKGRLGLTVKDEDPGSNSGNTLLSFAFYPIASLILLFYIQ